MDGVKDELIKEARQVLVGSKVLSSSSCSSGRRVLSVALLISCFLPKIKPTCRLPVAAVGTYYVLHWVLAFINWCCQTRNALPSRSRGTRNPSLSIITITDSSSLPSKHLVSTPVPCRSRDDAWFSDVFPRENTLYRQQTYKLVCMWQCKSCYEVQCCHFVRLLCLRNGIFRTGIAGQSMPTAV